MSGAEHGKEGCYHLNSTRYSVLMPNDDKHSIDFNYDDIKHFGYIKMPSNIHGLLHLLTNHCDILVNKIRSVFYWIAVADKSQIHFDYAVTNSCEFKFNQLLTSLAWKPKLFEFICRHMDVPNYTIRGIVRNIDYQPGLSNGDPSNNHTWNCVYIDNKWYTCDIIWTSNVIIKSDYDWCNEKTQRSLINIELSRHYFLVAPIKFRNTHFPTSDKKFQLLSDYITFEQFDNLPIFTESFYDSGLAEWKPELLPLVSNDGYFRLSIPCYKEVYLIHLLEYYDENLKTLIRKSSTNEQLKDYSIIEINNGYIVLHMRLPSIGIYYFTLFTQDIFESTLNCNFKALLKWKIQCLGVNPKITPFLGCHDIAYGHNWSLLRYYELEPINLIKGVMKIDYSPPVYFEAFFNKLNPDVNVIAKIRGSKALLPPNYQPNATLDLISHSCNGACLDYLIDEEDETDSEITIAIRLPTYGEYSLEIYANIPSEGDTFVQVAQYLLDIKKDKSDLIDAT